VAVTEVLVPFARDKVDGVTSIATNTALVTVSVADALTPDIAAVIVVVPAATDVAIPTVPTVLLMVAIPASEELQVTCVVRSWFVPSL
jgi:hypothetical protein